MHQVAVVALDGVVAFDLATPSELLGRVRLPDGRPGYHVRVCGASAEVDAGHFRMRLNYGLSEICGADTIILPGLADLSMTAPDSLVQALTLASRSGARIASICTGAFLLASTGLLDGMRATTHWLAASELAHRFPTVSVEPNVLFVDNGHLLTSAGACAGIDMCLHLVQRDYGAAVAAAAARIAVTPFRREGGQSQFLDHPPPSPDGVPLGRVLDWLEERLEDDRLTLGAIARCAATSVRTLSRQFRARTGLTPMQWLQLARVRRAKGLLETTSLSVERVASSAGFGSAASLRENFGRVVGTSPRAYRRAFQAHQPVAEVPAGEETRQGLGRWPAQAAFR